MKLTVVAATGGVGRHIVDQALKAGHDVTAVARNPADLDPAVRTFSADLLTATSSDLQPALAGADAVLSALGPRTRKDAGITETGTRTVLEAMAAVSVRRMVMISASPVGTFPTAAHPDRPRRDPSDDLLTGRVLYPIISVVFRNVYTDLSAAEDVVVASGLDWTIVRPPRLRNGPLTGRYRTSASQNLPHGRSISRADLAHLMLVSSTSDTTVHQTLRVGY